MADLRPVVLDLSHHNDVHDWQALKSAGIRGIILKCTQGRNYVDHTYTKRKAEARSAGLLVGAYHFCTTADPITQMEFFVQEADIDGNLLLALDWETYSDDEGTHTMSLDALKKAITHLCEITSRSKEHIVLYSGDVVKSHVTTIADAEFLGECKLWLAEYGPRAIMPKNWPGSFWLWQFSDRYDPMALGHGVSGSVDANRFGGSSLEGEWAPACAVPLISRTAPPLPREPDPILTETVEREQVPAQAELTASTPVVTPMSPVSPVTMAHAPAHTPPPPVVQEHVEAVQALTSDEPEQEPMPRQATLATDWSFVRINELADQGSRLAEHIRDMKNMFWKGSAITVGGTTVAGSFLDSTWAFASNHPFLLLFAGMAITGIAFYIRTLLVERYTLTAHADGRYMTRTQVGH